MTDKTKGGTNFAARTPPKFVQAKAPIRALHSSFFLSKDDQSPSLTASSMTPTSAKSHADSPPNFTSNERASPQPQAKLRKLPLKSKFRNPFTDAEEKEEAQHPSWTSVLELEEEVKRLKKDVRVKSQHAFESRGLEDEHRRPISRMSVDLDQQLERKDRQIQTLRQQLEASREPSCDPEMKRLANLFVASETNLAKVKAERDLLAAKVKEMEGRQSSSANLYEVLSRFQSENKMLMEEIRRLQTQVKSQSSFQTLERQFSELQTTQQQLLTENSRLRSEIDAQRNEWHVQQERLCDVSCSLREARRDVSQLTEIIRIVRNGSGVSAALILGHMAHSGQFRSVDENSEVTLIRETELVKSEITSLRQYLSDLYAEQSGSLCNPQ